MQGPIVPVNDAAMSAGYQWKGNSLQPSSTFDSNFPGTVTPSAMASQTTKTIEHPENLSLGATLPPGDPHGISVHLPKWDDTVGWASRDPRVLEAMKSGYPRFFIARVVDRLVMRLLEIQQGREAQASGGADATVKESGPRLAMLLDSVQHAQMCRRALPEWNAGTAQSTSTDDIAVYIVSWNGDITPVNEEDIPGGAESTRDIGEEDILLVSYPAELGPEAKRFWQHTGFGISSRRATHWLENAPFLASTPPKPMHSPTEISRAVDQARATLQERIAAGHSHPSFNFHVSPSDVFLFPAGMTAIAEAADAIRSIRTPTTPSPYRAAVFGFPYVDTYKLLPHVLGYHPTLYKLTPHSITTFESLLQTTTTRFHAIVTEFPGNPLLQSPDLHRLHTLSREYNIPLIVDDTVGTYTSLTLLPHCDVICTSLTKMFSGGCNVMGGAAVVNPTSPYYDQIKGVLEGRRGEEERAWFWEDVLVMEGNSRGFKERVDTAGRNAERMVGVLRGRGRVVAEVYYPKGSEMQEVYDRFRVEGGTYGFLVSIRFVRADVARAFYDALDVAKGPSLGTDFTLCCAYTLLAHYKELEWAAEYGVVEDLVRISVGLEEWEWLERRVEEALKAAEAALEVEGTS